MRNIKLKIDYWSIFAFLTAIEFATMALFIESPTMYLMYLGITNVYLLGVLSVIGCLAMFAGLVFIIYLLLSCVSIKYEINEED